MSSDVIWQCNQEKGKREDVRINALRGGNNLLGHEGPPSRGSSSKQPSWLPSPALAGSAAFIWEQMCYFLILNGICNAGQVCVFALDETLSALGHGQECFGSFLPWKVLGICYRERVKSCSGGSRSSREGRRGAGVPRELQEGCSFLFLRHPSGGEGECSSSSPGYVQS